MYRVSRLKKIAPEGPGIRPWVQPLFSRKIMLTQSVPKIENVSYLQAISLSNQSLLKLNNFCRCIFSSKFRYVLLYPVKFLGSQLIPSGLKIGEFKRKVWQRFHSAIILSVLLSTM